MSELKSLLITFDFPPIMSGISRAFYNIWKNLPRHNHLILAPRLMGYKNIDKNINLKIIRYFNFSDSRVLRICILILYTLVSIFKEKIDILICGSPLSLGFTGLVFKKMLGMPYCVFCYGGEFDKYKKRRIEMGLLKAILKNADYVVANSEYSSMDIMRFGLEAKKIFTITPAVDIKKFNPNIEVSDLKKRLNLDNKKVLLTVSRLTERKGIDAVISALPAVIREFPNTVYLVVGEGKQESRLHNLAKEKGVEKNIIFYGLLPDKELPDYYNLCDIYIMPNKETKGEEIIEGFGISFIEASACAKPVIGGISGGVKEAVADGETGILVDPEDTQKLTQTILRLLKDKAYAIGLGRAGRERVEREFKWDDRTRKIETLLRRIDK